MWTYTTFPCYRDIYIWATYTYKFSPINASSSFFFNKTSNAPSTNFRKLRSPNRADSPHRFNPSVTTALNSITKTLALNCTLLTDLGRVQRLQRKTQIAKSPTAQKMSAITLFVCTAGHWSCRSRGRRSLLLRLEFFQYIDLRRKWP